MIRHRVGMNSSLSAWKRSALTGPQDFHALRQDFSPHRNYLQKAKFICQHLLKNVTIP